MSTCRRDAGRAHRSRHSNRSLACICSPLWPKFLFEPRGNTSTPVQRTGGHAMTALSIGRLLALVCILAVSPWPVIAKDAKVWKVEGKLRGKPDGDGGFKKSHDVSGIACDTVMSPPRLCMIVDDETQGAQILLLQEGELTVGQYIPLTNAQYDEKPLELDAEAVAFDSGRFYVIGSHGRARHEDNAAKEAKGNAKAAATRQIFRIDLPVTAVDMASGKLTTQPKIKSSSALADIFQGLPEIAPWYDRALADNGLTVEGVAVHDKRFYVGLRGPVLGNEAVVVSAVAEAVFDGGPAEPQLHKLLLGRDKRNAPRGVRDIVHHGSGFLVLAGPVNDPEDGVVEDGDYAIYAWDGASGLKPIRDLQSYGKKVKPEALLPLDGDTGRQRILLLFDGPEEGLPRPIEVTLN
ncbi:MAG: DUF3616 domain-containing protein [Tardiphaga sp.]